MRISLLTKKHTLPIILLGLAATALSAHDAFARNIQFIFDASNSMWGQIEKKPKIEIAQTVFSDLIQNLSDKDINAGLMVYGHRKAKDCNDIEHMVKMQPLNKRELISEIKSVQPRGKTPIAASIESAVESIDKQSGEETTIILITDGKETCSKDPCGIIKELREKTKFTLHVVGFDIIKEDVALQLQCLSEAGGGGYFTASTIEGLGEAVKVAAVTSEKSPVTVDQRVQENIEIILDISEPMNKPFDQTTRIDAAQKALQEILKFQVADRDNLAFRQFGGSCNDERNTELVLDFGLNNTSRLLASMKNVRIGGKTTLFEAVSAAVDNFNDPKRFEGVSKRVLILTSGIDPCFRRKSSDMIRKMLENRKIRPDFRFIGMNIDPEDRLEFKNIAKATNGHAVVVDTQKQLGVALKSFFEVEPVYNDIMAIIDVQNSVINQLNKVIETLDDKNYSAAETGIKKAQKLSTTSIPPFRDLSRRRSEADFLKAFDIARKIRGLQDGIIVAYKDLVSSAKKNDAAAYDESLKSIAQLSSEYNNIADEGNRILTRLSSP